jgi:hypothetical protein
MKTNYHLIVAVTLVWGALLVAALWWVASAPPTISGR